MASPPVALNLYEFICGLIKPKKILEIGTFIGVSALTMAKATDEKCKIFTIEKFKEFFDIAKYNFKKNNQNTSSAFKCPKCKERNSVITQKQTRQADEPATLYIECKSCGYTTIVDD